MSKPPPQLNTITSYFTKAKAKASTTTTTTTSLSNNNSSTSLFESSPDDKKRNHSTTNDQNSTKSTKLSLLSSPSLSPSLLSPSLLSPSLPTAIQSSYDNIAGIETGVPFLFDKATLPSTLDYTRVLQLREEIALTIMSPVPNDVGSSNPLSSPGGGSMSNISLPSCSEYPSEHREMLQKMYIAGHRRGIMKLVMKPNGIGRPKEEEEVVMKQNGIGRPKEGEEVVMKPNDIGRPKEGEEVVMKQNDIGRPKEGEEVVMKQNDIGRPKEKEVDKTAVSITYFYLFICFNSSS